MTFSSLLSSSEIWSPKMDEIFHGLSLLLSTTHNDIKLLKHLQWQLSMAAPGFTWPNKIPLPSLLRRLSILDLSCRSYQFIAWWCDVIYMFCPFKILTKPSSQQLKISRPCMLVITICLVLLDSVLPHSLTMLRLWHECFKEGSACSQVNPASTIVGYSIRKTLVKTV